MADYFPEWDKHMVDCRKEVAEFAEAMEVKLRKNDHKTGWKDQPIEAHIKLLRIEQMEFDVALEFLGDDVAAKECIDIANFALIIRDKLLARMKAKDQPRPFLHCGSCPDYNECAGLNECQVPF